MADYTSPYRAVSHLETKTEDALSVRVYRDLEAAINNAKIHACAQKVLSEIFFPAGKIKSIDASTDETVMMVFAPRHHPDGFTHLQIRGCHKRVAGSGDVVWRLTMVPDLPTGIALIYDSTVFPSSATSTTWTTSSDDNAVFDAQLAIVTLWSGLAYYVLSCDASAGSQAELYTLDAWPILVET